MRDQRRKSQVQTSAPRGETLKAGHMQNFAKQAKIFECDSITRGAETQVYGGGAWIIFQVH
jgi:hypothetical protein